MVHHELFNAFKEFQLLNENANGKDLDKNLLTTRYQSEEKREEETQTVIIYTHSEQLAHIRNLVPT